MVARYRAVLSVPGAPRLLAAALVGRLPQGMSSLAILLLVRQSTHSYAVAGLADGAYTLASAVCAPIQGRLVDRYGRRRVLVPASVGQAIVLTGLVVAGRARPGAVPLVVLAAVAGTLMPPVAPTTRALLGAVFPDPRVRESAYALDSVAQELVWTLGPLLVALVIAAASPAVAVLLVGAVCVVGTALFVSSPLARGQGGRSRHEPRASVLGNRQLRFLLGPVFLTGFGLGATGVGLPALALHAGSGTASGLLLAVWSVGSMIGGLWFGARRWASSISARYRVLLVVAVVLGAPLIAARSVLAGVVGSMLAGVTIAPLFSCQYALVGRTVRPGTETEAFTWVSGALVSGAAAGTAVGGAAVGAVGIGAPFALACLATALAAAMATWVPEPLDPPNDVDLASAGPVKPLGRTGDGVGRQAARSR